MAALASVPRNGPQPGGRGPQHVDDGMVEVPGVEPGSFDTLMGLLRAQPVMSLGLSRSPADFDSPSPSSMSRTALGTMSVR